MPFSLNYGIFREPWRRSERIVKLDWNGHRFWLRAAGCEFLFKRDDLDSALCGAIFTEQPLNSGASPDELRAYFIEGWRAGRAARLLEWPDPLAPQQPVLVGINRDRFWFSMNASAYYTETTYSTQLSGDLWEISPAAIAHDFVDEWNDADSLPRRAWEWHRLSSEEKSWSQLAWQRGSRRELENLTRAMAHSDIQFWREHDWWATNYQIFADGQSKVHSVRGRELFMTSPPARIMRLGQLFLNHNRATLQRPPLLPALTPTRSFSPDGDAFLHLRFSAPSQHERLEAHLVLRAWLADKVSPSEAKQLLPAI